MKVKSTNLATKVSQETGINSLVVKDVLDSVVDIIVLELQNKRSINLLNLCTFNVTDLVKTDVDSNGNTIHKVEGQVKVKLSTSLKNKVNEDYGRIDYAIEDIENILDGLNR